MILKSNLPDTKNRFIKVVLAVSSVMLLFLAFSFFPRGSKTKDIGFPDPSRTIELVVPFAPDGKMDIMFRQLTDNMQKNGVNIEVVNVTGNGGVTGIEYVLSKDADGYTLLASSAATIIATLSGKTEGFKKLTTVAGLNEDPFLLVTKKGRFKDFQELLDCAEVKELSIVTAGEGTLGHKVASNLTEKLGPSFKHRLMETDGGTGEMDAVYSGLADIGILTQFEVISNPYMQPLVILTGGHSQDAMLRSIPTINEEGIKLDIPGSSFCSVMVRNDIPQNVITILAGLVEEAYYSDDFQSFQKSYSLLGLYLPLNQGDNFFQDLVRKYN